MDKRVLIICVSVHHGNTQKIAEVMAPILDAEVVKPEDVDITTLSKYDLIGFGSGIYYVKHHESLLALVDKLPVLENKKAFTFCTHGGNKSERALKKKLSGKGFDIIGEFSCLGFDTWGPFERVGGIHKGRPNAEDFEKARGFARELLKELETESKSA